MYVAENVSYRDIHMIYIQMLVAGYSANSYIYKDVICTLQMALFNGTDNVLSVYFIPGDLVDYFLACVEGPDLVSVIFG
jgi:hypothetical protein